MPINGLRLRRIVSNGGSLSTTRKKNYPDIFIPLQDGCNNVQTLCITMVFIGLYFGETANNIFTGMMNYHCVL